jgi:hypothetical protein
MNCVPYALTRSAALVVIAFIALAVPHLAAQASAAQKSVVGTWVGQTEVPDQGTDQVTMTIAKTETGYAGTIADSLGNIAGTTEMKNVAFVNDELTGSFSLGDGATVSMKLKLDGDSLKGTWEHESGGAGQIVLTRQKK